MAEALLDYETMSKDQIDDIMAGVPVRPPKDVGGGQGASKGGGDQAPLGPKAVGGPVGEH